MDAFRLNRNLYSALLVGAILFSSFSVIGSTATLAQAAPPPIWQVRAIGADQTGINQPIGLVFSSRLNAFYALDAKNWKPSSPTTDLIGLTPTEARAGSARIAAAIQDPINMVYDNQADRLLILQPKQLLEVPAANGQLDAQTVTHHNISSFGLQDPQGLTLDPLSGDLFILDAAGPSIVRISGGLESGTLSVVDLASSGIVSPHGIAFDPSTGYLQVVSSAQQKLYELTQAGEVAAVRDLSQFNLTDIQGMVFAPSGDQTDDPAQMSLYVADAGSSTASQSKSSTLQSTGQIVELSLVAAATLPPGTTLLPATLIHIIDTSNAAWSPSAPDPAGVDYWPLASRLLITDSEVDEMPIYFTGKNVYLSTINGNLTGTCSTTSFTNEPTGVAINPNNNHIFISTDENDRVFEVSIGPDATYCTADDTVTSTDVSGLYNITDAEDVAYGNNTVFVAGGISAEVYRIPLGPNGVLGGGDDGPMTHFDTARWGFSDLEGIGFNADNGTLFIISTKGTDRYLGEVTTTGTFFRAYDLSFMGTAGNIRSDVAYGPSSQNPAVKSIFIASRGVDNDSNRKENDGRVWEINISASAKVDVYIGPSKMGTYDVPLSGSIALQYPGAQSGPVRVISTNAVPFFTSERSIYGNSFNEVMGYPANQLTTQYYFPWYDQVNMNTWLLVGNPNTSQTAHVEIFIAGTSRGIFNLLPGQIITPQFPGVQDGPVKVVSDINVFSSERSLYFNSFNEVMGYPANQLTTQYYFPWYDQVNMNTWVLVGNPSTSQTAHVQIFIAGTSRGTFNILPGKSITPQFSGVQNGPVKVVSDINIFTSERSIYSGSFNEVMGYPANQLTTQYYFPWYDQINMNTWLLVGNPSASQTAHVEIYIAGTSRGTFTIQPGKSITPQFSGVQDGSVKVVSDINVFTSERSLYSNSFNEMMGYPGNLLTIEYYFTWYDNRNMLTWVQVGKP